MPYYYYGGGVDYSYLLLLLPVFLFALWAQLKVSGSYRKYNAVRNARGMTGAEAAMAVLRYHRVQDVGVAMTRGTLTDHYDPRSNTIYLSESVYRSPTIAAVGVAAHEAGHAVQYAEGYGPVRIRTAILPVCNFGSQFAFIALFLGLILYSQRLLLVGIVLFGLATLFQLITLPVEFNASRRALATIEDGGFLTQEEYRGARKVLSAAAMTYVAALLTSLVHLLRYLVIFLGRGGGRDRR
ncbi:MAG: zinc metallopeptidase [Oscillospiraceae bacterium]